MKKNKKPERGALRELTKEQAENIAKMWDLSDEKKKMGERNETLLDGIRSKSGAYSNRC